MSAFDPNSLLAGIPEPGSSFSGQWDHAKAANPAKVSAPAYRRPAADWSADDWRYFFHERAGIREHHGRLTTAEAERLAVEDCIAQWRALHPVPASEPQGGCIHCHGASDGSLVSHLAAGRSHFWLHRGCWPAFDAARRESALADFRHELPEIFKTVGSDAAL